MKRWGRRGYRWSMPRVLGVDPFGIVVFLSLHPDAKFDLIMIHVLVLVLLGDADTRILGSSPTSE
jgi:hypothetical protein